MKMYKLYFILLCIATKTTFAQNILYQPNTAIRAAYMGSIIHQGFKAGIERPYKVLEIRKRSKTVFKERGFAFNSGIYHHKTHHTNLFLQGEWFLRRQKTGGFFYDFSLGSGVSRTFLGGATYEIDSQNKLIKISGAGDTYALTSMAWTVGYNMDLKKKGNMRFFIKPSIMLFFPYNNFIYLRPTTEFGITYKLNNFWKINPTLKR